MAISDQEDEQALSRLVAQPGSGPRPAPGPGPGAPTAPEHPLDALLRWWGGLRFAAAADRRTVPPGKSR